MTKKDIMNDIKFRENCNLYGLDWTNFDICYLDETNYLIVVRTYKDDVYVLFDKNYDTICIDRAKFVKDQGTLEFFAKTRYNHYCEFTDDMPFGENFGYPFEEFTLKNFVDISNRIEMTTINHGHSNLIRINGQIYDSEFDDDYLHVLSYIKFISEEIKKYHFYNYHMKMMGFEVPDIYSYIRTIMIRVNECIDYYVNKNMRPYPGDIMDFIGQGHRQSDFDHLLFEVIELLLKERGYKIKSGHCGKIESLERKVTNDLSLTLKKVFSLLDVPEEEFKKIEEERLARFDGSKVKGKVLKREGNQ